MPAMRDSFALQGTLIERLETSYKELNFMLNNTSREYDEYLLNACSNINKAIQFIKEANKPNKFEVMFKEFIKANNLND